MRNTISGQVFAEMIFCASAALDENRQQLNELNVFPVPDAVPVYIAVNYISYSQCAVYSCELNRFS